MPPRRVCYLAASLGFVGSAVGAGYGFAPHWPSNVVWIVVAVVAAASLAIVGFRPSGRVREAATSTAVVASGARLIGWTVSDGAWQAKVTACGVWLIIGSLLFLVHSKARELQRMADD